VKIRFRPITVDLDTRQLMRDSREIPLSSKAARFGSTEAAP
jgi:hypothetical protein